MSPREITWSFWHIYIMEGFDGQPLDENGKRAFSKNIGDVMGTLKPMVDFSLGRLSRDQFESNLDYGSSEPVRSSDIALLFYSHAIKHYDLDQSLDIFENPYFINNTFDILHYLQGVRDNPEKIAEADPHKEITLNFLKALGNPPEGYHPLGFGCDDDDDE